MVLAPVLVSKLIHKQSTDFQNPGDNDMSQNSRIILRYIVVQIEIKKKKKKKKDKKSIVQIHKINLIVEMKKIIYTLYLISLGSFGLKLDSRSCLTPGVTNTILLLYKFFLQKGIYVIVVLTNGFLFFVFYFLIKNRLDLRKIVFFSLMVLDFALMKLSSQIVVVSVG